MAGMRVFAVLFLLGGCARAEAPRPTQNGDVVGMAMMLEDGSIHMRLRSVECSGMIAEGTNDLPANSQGLKVTLERLGPMKPGESKPILASGVEPCPKK